MGGGVWETETANGSVPADRGASVSQSGLLLAESGGGEDNSNNNTSVLRSKPRRKYAPCFTCANPRDPRGSLRAVLASLHTVGNGLSKIKQA